MVPRHICIDFVYIRKLFTIKKTVLWQIRRLCGYSTFYDMEMCLYIYVCIMTSHVHEANLTIKVGFYLRNGRWDGIVGYLTSYEAYCVWVGYHFQVIIYTHEDEVI